MSDLNLLIVVLVSVLSGAALLWKLIEHVFPKPAAEITQAVEATVKSDVQHLTDATNAELSRLHSELENFETLGTTGAQEAYKSVLTEIARLNQSLADAHQTVVQTADAVKNATVAAEAAAKASFNMATHQTTVSENTKTTQVDGVSHTQSTVVTTQGPVIGTATQAGTALSVTPNASAPQS